MLSPGSRQNVGYRLGLRNVLSERRKRVADYSLVCALFGLVVVIIETELSLAQLYDKVRFCHQYSGIRTLSLCAICIWLYAVEYYVGRNILGSECGHSR